MMKITPTGHIRIVMHIRVLYLQWSKLLQDIIIGLMLLVNPQYLKKVYQCYTWRKKERACLWLGEKWGIISRAEIGNRKSNKTKFLDQRGFLGHVTSIN